MRRRSAGWLRRGGSRTLRPPIRRWSGNTGVNSLRRELWRQYASSRADEPAEVALSKLKFLKDDRQGALRATVGGVLLAAEDPREWLPNAWIQAVCYRGVRMDAGRQIDAQDVAGPLDQQIRDAVRFVVRNRRVAAYKDPARADVPQFSERAVFEAVVNAVVHRDYAVSGSRIRLFLFDDRLELYSPGGLCNSMTTDDLRTSQFTRNELLASRLGQCPVGDVPGAGGRRCFIERRGEGIAVIEDETFALAGERPVFALIGERELQVVLPAASPPRPEGVAACVTVRHGGHGPAGAGRERADALPQPDVSRGAHGRGGARRLRALREAADDGAVRGAGTRGARDARSSARRAAGGPHGTGRGRGLADHRRRNRTPAGHAGAAESHHRHAGIARTSTRTTSPSTTDRRSRCASR